MSANESFNSRWRNITKKELSAEMYGDREVGYESMLCVGIWDDHGRGDQFGKVVHDQSGKDLLADELHLFCMEVEQAKGVFQLPEGGFNAPAHMIELLQFQGRKRFRIQIGENGFVGILRNLKSNNAKGQVIENGGIVLAVIAGEEIKGSRTSNYTILVSAFAAESFDAAAILIFIKSVPFTISFSGREVTFVFLRSRFPPTESNSGNSAISESSKHKSPPTLRFSGKEVICE